MPHEPGRLREPPEIVGTDIVFVDFGLAVARRSGLDRMADVGPGIQPAHDVQTGRLDDVLERAARVDREADCPAADGQARHALWRPRGKEERRGRADIRADDMRSSEAPLVDQPGQERSGGVRSDQLRATVGVAESRHVDGDHPPTAATRFQMRRKAQRLSGHGASSSTVVSESALVSANLTRTPSQTRKYVLIVETAWAPI